MLLNEGLTYDGTSDTYIMNEHGWIIHKNLYAKYNGKEWMVSIGGGGKGPWKRPAQLHAQASFLGFSAELAGKYNRIIKKIVKINELYKK